jgi:hypothetical protein
VASGGVDGGAVALVEAVEAVLAWAGETVRSGVTTG